MTAAEAAAAKRGTKAARALTNEEAAIRAEAMLQEQKLFSEIEAQGIAEYATVKDRLIFRLSTTLEELRSSSTVAIAEAQERYEEVTHTVAKLEKRLADEQLVEPTLQFLLLRETTTAASSPRAGTPVPSAVPPPGTTGQQHAIIVERMEKFGRNIAELLHSNTVEVKDTRIRMADLQRRLQEAEVEAKSAHRIIDSHYLNGRSIFANELLQLRQKAAEFEKEMKRLKAEQQAAFKKVIDDSAVVRYYALGGDSDKTMPSAFDQHPSKDVIDNFLSKEERVLLSQSLLLEEVSELSIKAAALHLTHSGDGLRRGKSPFPKDVTAVLRDPTQTSREDLLRLLFHVGYESNIAVDNVAAAVRMRSNLRAAPAPEDDIVVQNAGAPHRPGGVTHDEITALVLKTMRPVALDLLPLSERADLH